MQGFLRKALPFFGESASAFCREDAVAVDGVALVEQEGEGAGEVFAAYPGQAVGQLEQGAFNEAQLQGYDDFWDAVRVERTLMTDALREGHARGHEMGLAEGRAEGRAEERLEIARNLKSSGIPVDVIIKSTGLSEDEIAAI